MIADIRLADGRALPQLRFGVSDGTIDAATIDRFAQDIANQISSNRVPQRN